MKNLKGFFALVFITLLFAGQAVAQDASPKGDDQKGKQTVAAAQNCGKFVDSDKNGICDNYQARGKDGKGANFVDANGDGICDRNPDCKGGCNGKEGCCKGQQNCGKGAKEQGCQYRHSCAGHCPEKRSPEKK